MADEPPSDTETLLLDAALAEVLSHGIRRTTASDIARRAGVSRQTLYRYWSDAEALFAALLTRELLAVLPSDEPAQTLEALTAEFVDTADRVRTLPLVHRLRDTDPELFARYILQRLGTSQHVLHSTIAARLAGGHRAGFVRDGDPQRLAAMVLLIAQSAVQSAPLVEEWLPGNAWRVELAHALSGYLATEGRQA